MRTAEELIAAWRGVVNDISPRDQAANRVSIEETIEWLREQAEGNGSSAPTLHIEITGTRWSPGQQLAAHRALLPELAALDNDEDVALVLIREIPDNLVRDLVASDYIAILAASSLFKRAQTVTNFLEFAHPQIRCKALLAIASASHEPHDLYAARSSADRLVSIEKVRALLDIYGLIHDSDDLSIARETAKQLEPSTRRIACEHIALATDKADDYLNALDAAESITDDAARLKAITGALLAIASAFSSEGKSAMSKETLRAIAENPKLDKYPFWKKSALGLL